MMVIREHQCFSLQNKILIENGKGIISVSVDLDVELEIKFLNFTKQMIILN